MRYFSSTVVAILLAICLGIDVVSGLVYFHKLGNTRYIGIIVSLILVVYDIYLLYKTILINDRKEQCFK